MAEEYDARLLADAIEALPEAVPIFDPAELLEQADAALYRAKRQGRNTFGFADDASSGTPGSWLATTGAPVPVVDNDGPAVLMVATAWT